MVISVQRLDSSYQVVDCARKSVRSVRLFEEITLNDWTLAIKASMITSGRPYRIAKVFMIVGTFAGTESSECTTGFARRS